MPDLDPAAVMEAVARDPLLRVFTDHGRIDPVRRPVLAQRRYRALLPRLPRG